MTHILDPSRLTSERPADTDKFLFGSGLANLKNQEFATLLAHIFLSPDLTGVPTTPTPAAGDDSTKIANTAFVQALFNQIVGAAPATLDTLAEIAAAINDDENLYTTLSTLIGQKLAKASNLSDLADAATARSNLGLGTVALLNAIGITDVSGLTEALAALQVGGGGDMFIDIYDPTNKNGDAFDRTKHHGVQPQSSITDLATNLAAKAPLVSPALTGTPTAPTPISTTNNTQIATTAFVKGLIDTLLGGVAGGGDTLFELYAEILNNDTAIDALNAAIGNKLNKNFDNVEDAAAARTALGLGAVAMLASIGIANVDGLTAALAGKQISMDQVSAVEKAAGTEESLRSFSPKDVADMSGGGGGDFSDGGEAGGSARTLGNKDNYPLAFIINDNDVLSLSSSLIDHIISSVAMGTVSGIEMILRGKSAISWTYNISTKLGDYLSIKSSKVGSQPFTIGNLGQIGIGATTWGASATNILALADGVAPTTNIANQANLYSLLGELYVKDAAGNQTLLSPHATDAPDWLYDVEDPMPAQINRETNDFDGIVRYTNNTRKNRLLEMQFNGEALPDGDARKIIFTESYEEHFERTGELLTRDNWDVYQEREYQASLKAIEKYNSDKAAFDLRKLEFESSYDQRLSDYEAEKLAFEEKGEEFTKEFITDFPETFDYVKPNVYVKVERK